MEVIKAQMQKDEAPPVAPPHAPAHGLQQPINLIAGINNNNANGLDVRKGPRPASILRHSGLAAPS